MYALRCYSLGSLYICSLVAHTFPSLVREFSDKEILQATSDMCNLIGKGGGSVMCTRELIMVPI